MVLWEITLGTAYFLGLKRTYRLACRIQRRVISSKHPRFRHFVHRRVRGAFDVALTVHKNIQQRDIEVGRNLGNWILRWLDRMKPSAHIRGDSPGKPIGGGNNVSKHVTTPGQQLGHQRPQYGKHTDLDSVGRSFFSPMSVRPRTLQTLSKMLRRVRPAGVNNQCRHLLSVPSMSNATSVRGRRFEGVFREDIMQWMKR